jgi:hypothetical protein
MKNQRKHSLPALLALGLTLLAATSSQAQITVKVDSTKNWVGYMGVYELPENGGGWTPTSSPWGLPDLRGEFVPDKATGTRVVLRINTNTYNPANTFWNLPDGTPQKNLEANFYVDVPSAFGGQEVTFVGTVESNTLPVGWTCEAVIKEFAPGYAYIGDTRAAVVTGQPFSVVRPIAAGNIAQYGFLTFGPNTAPGSAAALEGVSILVDNADPSITGEPVKQRVLVGGSASFSVQATGGSALSYQWKRYDTNLVNQPGKFTGATSATLTVLNAQLEDATTYSVTVTSTAGTANSLPARLRVLTPEQFANLLDNPSFEEDVVAFQTVPAPWVNFTGSALLTEGVDFPWGDAQDGTNVVQVFNAGAYNGIYQDVPAAPGDAFTGDCWMFQSSFAPLSAPINEAYLEVQFWSVAGATPIAIYNSILITNSPAFHDAWLHLEATNGVAAGYAQTSTSNAQTLVAPDGTSRVRFQVTLHYEGGGPGDVYIDGMRLLAAAPVIKNPVTISVALTGGNIVLSWPSALSSSYQVVYKDNLNDANWTSIGDPIPGDGTVKSASFPTAGSQRFYSVLTQ